MIVDHWTKEDIISVELDPGKANLLQGILSTRTACSLTSSVQSADGLKTLEYNCEKSSTANVWVVLNIPTEHSLAVYDIYMYGKSRTQEETYDKKEQNIPTMGMLTLSSSSYYTTTQVPSSEMKTPEEGRSYASSQAGASYSRTWTAVPRSRTPAYHTTSWHFQFTDVFSKSDGDYVTWQPEFEDVIPYKELMDKQEKKVEKKAEKQEEVGASSNFLGVLTGAGYLDYVMTMNKVEGNIDDAKKEAKEDSNSRLFIDSDDIENSILVFQKFNGFPETGALSRDILEFVKQPRCGNHDVEYTIEEVKEEALLCDTAFSRSKPTQVYFLFFLLSF